MKERVDRVCLAALFACLMLSACVVSENEENEGIFGAQGKEMAENLNGKKIASVILLEDQTEKILQTTMRITAKKYGATVIEGQSGGELERETVLINQYMDQGVDAICIYPVSPTGSAVVLEKASQKGIDIFSADLNMDKEWQVGYCEADQYNIGCLVGEECAKYIKTHFAGHKPKTAIIQFSALLLDTSAERTNGFLSVVGDMIDVVQDVDAWDSDTSMPIVKEVLEANPDLEMIFCANEGGTVGAVMAVRNLGLDIPVFGIDITEQLVNMMLAPDEILQALGGQDPIGIGENAMDNLCRYMLGEEFDGAITIPGVILSRSRPEEAIEYMEMTRQILEQGKSGD